MNIMRLTDKGRQLMAKIEAGDLPLKITRILTGKSTSRNPEQQTEVQDPAKELEITDKYVENGRLTIRTIMTNETLAEGYDLWQIGIYAKDPDEGEILYRIMQFDSPRIVPAEQETVWAYAPEFTFATGNASIVKVDVIRTGYVLRSELKVFDCGYFTDEADLLREHNSDAFAHENMYLDGNAIEGGGSADLESHEVNPSAHKNLIIDGN